MIKPKQRAIICRSSLAIVTAPPCASSDLGQAVDSVEDSKSAGLKDGKPSVLLILNKQSGANIIETVDKIKVAFTSITGIHPERN